MLALCAGGLWTATHGVAGVAWPDVGRALGAAVATAMNWRMVRWWGHTTSDFTTFCLLTNLLDVATKLVLPLVGAFVLLLVSAHVPPALWAVCSGCVGGLAAVGEADSR